MSKIMALFTEGKTAFGYLEEALECAEKSIDIQMFIWRDDPLGRRLLGQILALADRGVQIDIRKDLMGAVFELAEESRGSLFHDRLSCLLHFRAWMLNWGYPIRDKPSHFSLGDSDRIKALYRQENLKLSCDSVLNDHSKYIIIDDRQLIISGMNFEEKEYSSDLLGRRYFDFMLSVDSEEAVKSFRVCIDTVHRPLDEPTEDLDFIRNSDKGFHIREGIIDRLTQAKKQITIVMPYIGHKEVSEVLVRQCHAGVEVRIYMPCEANVQNDLNLKTAEQLMHRTGGMMNIYLCSQMIHGKLIMVDGDYVTFGSANLNRLSLEVLHETNIGFFSRCHGLDATVMAAVQQIQAHSFKIEKGQRLYYNKYRAFLEGLV